LLSLPAQATPETAHDSPTGAAGSTTTGPASDTLTLRALVSTRDAGIIIGKQGKNVADLREHTGVKAGVSKVMPGVHERVLSVSGSVSGVAKVRTYLETWSLVSAEYFLDFRPFFSAPLCTVTRHWAPTE
jgi:heterogeneous nuclear rnp K-like protein 2